MRGSLLLWYDQNRRELPWRKTRDPYRIWVSEIMLQQTRVSAVVARYDRFIRKFPSLESLARANPAAILAEWSGLGYYRRARNLHAAARVIADGGDGKYPRAAADWHKLPGIGRYTAAAISSIAFDEQAAVVDGNVERVLRRLLGRMVSKRESWSAAQELVDPARPGDFNQAMIELGATVCLPGVPRCPECPIRKFCRTRGRGAARSRKPRREQRHVYYGLATRRGSVLLVRRSPTEGLMPGMWELPALDRPSIDPIIVTVRHSITVTDYTVTVVAYPGAPAGGAKWVRISRLDQLPLTGLTKKILRKAGVIE
ncbi:MAG: A/G-specific adenine glycosylase [Acidobacteria bacterium]|nr:A/G-specific adenine glycosylase [Acidobacteriota bacterium]